MKHARLALLAAFLLLLRGGGAHSEDFQGATHQLDYDQPPISYSKASPADPITRLQEKILRREIKLHWDDTHGYLPALLEALSIPVSSQLLVFSKTSLQRKLISAQTPRALYFNDDVYIGYIPGSPVLEISAADPTLGATFYHLDQEEVRRPRMERDANCLGCHGGTRSLGIPGHVLRSVANDSIGEPDPATETSNINHCTPVHERWAGWFVTGSHGSQNHRGNLINAATFASVEAALNPFDNLQNLAAIASSGISLQHASFPATTSDIVAHLVLDHQVHMHNYIARLSFEARIMEASYGHLRYLKPQTDAFLRYLLFAEEAPLDAPVSGDPAFTEAFRRMSPRDSKGRSLRDFNLQTRLFKHPCSYLIYSDAFAKMHPPMKSVVMERLLAILNNSDRDPQFARLTTEDRSTLLEILRDTLPDLPESWRP